MLTYFGNLTNRTRWILLLAGCGVFFFVWPTHVPLTEVDEARFAEASREMLKSSDYIIPMFNFEPRYRKPIFIYWLQAGSMRIFGVNETAARLPSAAASTLLVLFLYGSVLTKLRRRDKSEATSAERGAAFIGAFSLFLMPFVTVYARAAITDATLSLFIASSLICLLQADLNGNKQRRWYLLAALFAALGMLTKGPIGLVIPGVVWLIYHLLQKDLRLKARTLPWVSAIIVFFAVAAPWYVATYFVDGPNFLRWFFLKEHVERYTTTMQGHGVGSSLLGLFTYLPIALIFAFPISAFVVYEIFSPFGGNWRLAEEDQIGKIRRFACVWIAVVIGIFSLSRTQLPEYIQSIPAAMAILFAINIEGRYCSKPSEAIAKKSKPAHRAETFVLSFFGILWTALAVWALLLGKAKGRIGELAFVQWQAAALVVILGASGIALLLAALCFRRRIGLVLATWTIFFAALIFGAAPMFVRSTYELTVQMGRYLKSLPANTQIIAFFDDRPEGIVFYSERRINFFRRGQPDEETAFLAAIDDAQQKSSPTFLLTDKNGLKKLPRKQNFRILHQVGHSYVLTTSNDEHSSSN